MEEIGYQVLDFFWEYPITLILLGVGVFFGLRRLMPVVLQVLPCVKKAIT